MLINYIILKGIVIEIFLKMVVVHNQNTKNSEEDRERGGDKEHTLSRFFGTNAIAVFSMFRTLSQKNIISKFNVFNLILGARYTSSRITDFFWSCNRAISHIS